MYESGKDDVHGRKAASICNGSTRGLAVLDHESILIHGRGKFNCSTPGIVHGLCNATNPQCSPHSITVKPNQIIRLRIGSLTTLSTLSFEIEDHVMIVVEADGSYVQPFETKHLYIYSGETYSVLIKTKPSSLRNYWISAKVVSRESQTPKGLAILNYSPNPPLQNPPTNPPYGPLWNDTKDRIIQSRQYRAHIDYIVPPPKTSDKVIILLNTQNKVNGGVRWSLNNVSLNLPHTPYLIALKENLTNAFDDKTSPPEIHPDYENYDIYSVAKNKEATTSNAIYRLKFNSVVDVILQNTNTMTKNVSETHPWHLHGHDFWVLGYGEGKFDLSRDPAENYNLKNPIMKNTVALHPYGWTALRFRADNPGVWVFHCHIEYHYALGMAVVFESGVDQLPELPNSIKGCGLTKGNYKP